MTAAARPPNGALAAVARLRRATAGSSPTYPDLIAAARNPNDVITLTLAGVITNAPQRPAPYHVPIAGLAPQSLSALLADLFPRLTHAHHAALLSTPAEDAGIDEFHDLVTLLLEHRTHPDATSHSLAHALATACMGANHLWQDLGLPHRRALSELMGTHFTTLARRNTGDMKWKKFLYKQLCEQEEIFVCKSPSCAECSDYQACFGPE
ncbi:nitrogen fixation protein NifQ [Azoarcus sp. KH32C]|uniref:nitrogen fixation protein NifQ n=1 Tax=Azoarcus sp. KH32C TaxID=748247 RepID=UPI0012EA84B9|nr:nitrogen fixation protein NifQ [Azoarcus sp. KH32C]